MDEQKVEVTVDVKVEFTPIGGDIMMVVGTTEVWWTADQLAEFLDMGTQALGDALEQLGAVVS